jgi:hypothetical protein
MLTAGCAANMRQFQLVRPRERPCRMKTAVCAVNVRQFQLAHRASAAAA